MDERGARAKEIFLDAQDLPADERDAFLARACAGDAELEARVRELIRAREEASEAEILARPRATTAPTDDPTARIRRALSGRYEIADEAGVGGMAVVYRAHDAKHDRTVAIKVLKPSLAASIGGARFLREIRIAAGLQHPGILPLHDSGDADGLLYAVMPFVEGETLQQRLADRGPLPLDEVVAITREIAEALDYAHARGLVHRDIKPGNVLLSSGHAVLADFGLATAIEGAGDERLTGTGVVLGTPAYMSPEQAAGTDTVDPRCDIYSLGCLVYEMIAGHPPFEGSSIRAVIARHLHDDVPSLDAARPGLPAGLAAAIDKALAKEPADRYDDGTSFVAALEAAVHSAAGGSEMAGTPTAGPASASPSIDSSDGRPLPGPLLALSLILILVAGFAIAKWGPWETDDISPATPSPTTRADPSTPATSGGDPSTSASSKSGAPTPHSPAQDTPPADTTRPPTSPPQTRPAATNAPMTVAVLPFTVHGGGDYDYLGAGLVDLLGTKLDGAGGLRSVDSHALISFVEREAPDAVRERAGAERVADHFGSGLFLQGDVLEVGGRLHVTASLYAVAETDPIGRASVEGEAEQIFELLDDLAAQLLAERFAGAASRLSRTAATTTSSLPALKAFLHADELFRIGQFSESLDAFQAAVDHDPGFALAWYRLSVAAEWALRQDRTETAAQKALSLSDRLSDHDRRLLQARLANRRGDDAESERLYRAILALHPDDVEALLQLAEVQFHYGPMRGRSLSDAREAYERVLYYQPESVATLWHLARIAASEGDADEVARLVDAILALNPDSERALEMEALRAFAGDDADDQERVLAELADARESVVALAHWNVGCFANNWQGTRRIAELNTHPERADDARAVAHIWLAYLDVGEGRWASAWEQLDAAAALRPGWALEHRALLAVAPDSQVSSDELPALRDALLAWDASSEPEAVLPTTWFASNEELHVAVRLQLLGLVEARLGVVDAAERAAALEMLEPPSSSPFLMSDYAAEVRARIAWEAGDTAAALAELDGTRRQVLYQVCISSPFAAQAYGRLAHAQALAAAGRDDEAAVLWSSFEHVSSYELAFVATATAERARIRAARGDREAAEADYARVLHLWRRADESLGPRIEGIRRSLEALRD